MGRGRAKAKQTKVARKLKYQSLDTDLTALQRELAGSEGDGNVTDVDDLDNDLDDEFGDQDFVDDEDDYDYSGR
jgi:hypothetical protein